MRFFRVNLASRSFCFLFAAFRVLFGDSSNQANSEVQKGQNNMENADKKLLEGESNPDNKSDKNQPMNFIVRQIIEESSVPK
ncbi:MAG: hypothetical protein NZO16_00515 [Deltaproteobacteria bacterium]|nr:hypothetical protein [Deltaproteobacteria bacterium]